MFPIRVQPLHAEINLHEAQTLGGTPLTRPDDVVNFDWGFGSPHPAIPVNDFSVRWRGEIQPRYSEPCTFYVSSDDGVRLWRAQSKGHFKMLAGPLERHAVSGATRHTHQELGQAPSPVVVHGRPRPVFCKRWRLLDSASRGRLAHCRAVDAVVFS